MFPKNAGKDSIWVSSNSLDNESGRKWDLHNNGTITTSANPPFSTDVEKKLSNR